jgi:hypothetical protein
MEGNGQTSIFTGAILEALKDLQISQQEISTLYKAVTNRVQEKTGRRQSPYQNTNMGKGFVFRI